VNLKPANLVLGAGAQGGHAPPLVRKTPSRPRSWANFSLLWLYSRNAWANLHLLGQPDTFLSLLIDEWML
jgi:hypothetical protein